MKRIAFTGGIGPLALGLLVSVWAATAPAMAFVLVTPAEYARERARGGAPAMRGDERGDMGSPEIVLVHPKAVSHIRSPADIELRFIPKSPAKIVLGTLRVLYGFFDIDVTDRLLKNSTVTASGIVAKGASLPEGSHSITIEVADSKERVGRKTFRFEVTESAGE